VSQTLEEKASASVRYLDIGEEAGQRIDNYLVARLPGVPKSRIYRIIRRGEVRVNGGRIKPTYRLSAGDRVRVPPLHLASRPPPAVGQRDLARIEAAIIFENDRLLVLNKPAGVAVHGGSGVSYGIIEGLRRLRPEARLELAHRLDRETSGCLLVAKGRQSLLEVHAAMRERTVRKRYEVIVHGRWPGNVRTVRLPLKKYTTSSGERRVRVDAQGKPSRTDFEVVERSQAATWLVAHLHTGRTHQIRVHAKASGHEVVGDEKYGQPEQRALEGRLGISGMCLHAEGITLVLEGKKYKFSCPVPDTFAAAWERLSEDVDPLGSEHDA
jgi:23S rRNA pseudouridine955/2504/2580 synthase